MSKKLPETQEELDSLIQAEVANATKKLQKEFEALKSEHSTLTKSAETHVSALAAKDKEIEGLKTRVQTFEAGDGTDISKIIAEASSRTETKLRAEYDKKFSDLNVELEALRKKEKEIELKSLRDRLIQEAGGDDALLPSLVKGNTEQELRDSIAFSKKTFEEATARFKKSDTPPAAPSTATATPPAAADTPSAPAQAPVPAAVPPVPAAPAATSPSAAPTSPGRMSRSEWASRRTSALSSLAGRYVGPGAV